MQRAIDFHSQHSNTADRFDDFCAWGEPGGNGGFNTTHDSEYQADTPWFAFSARLTPHSHSVSRSWFLKQEHLGRTGIFERSTLQKTPHIKIPEALITGPRFLRFAKTYINIYVEIRGVRSSPRAPVTALIMLERALRDLNDGNNDPSLICRHTFHHAERVLEQTSMSAQKIAESGKALEQLALMLQGGGRPQGAKKRAGLIGFHLLNDSFSFTSKFKSPPRYGRKELEDSSSSIRRMAPDSGQLHVEEVAAIGMAYRRARERTGLDSFCTFVAALLGLTMTTASMRASELQLLRTDALYETEDQPQRIRLRIPRPKIGIEQDVPIPSKLAPLAQEFFEVLLRHSQEAREAFAFYLRQSPTSQADLHTLFIPERLKHLFEPAYLDREQVSAIFDSAPSKAGFEQRINGLPRVFFVHEPGDVYGSRPNVAFPLIQIRHVVQSFRHANISYTLPKEAKETQFVSIKTAQAFAKDVSNRQVSLLLRDLFKTEYVRKCKLYISRAVLTQFLLDQFKTQFHPHWPYATKDRSIRLDEALAVCYAADMDRTRAPGTHERCWWRPTLLSIQVLNYWIARHQQHPPLLFALLDIKLNSGEYPSISIHRTRKFHHTAALLAGANSLFIDQLAGRQSGWQSEHYDFRTPQEIVRQSIDTFDPNEDFIITGPIEAQAPPKSRLRERKAFLIENAAPKHVTEIGGCRTDWSLNPCYQHGDCMRCDSHVWRKGDHDRASRINDIMTDAQRTIEIGQAKLLDNPRMTSVEKQVRQAKETVQRCVQILEIEADPSVTVGTIVTFDSAPSAMTSAQLSSQLRST